MTDSFALEGYLPDDRKFGFRTPVFVEKASGRTYIQIVSEFEDLTANFQEINVGAHDLVKISDNSEARIGNEPIAVFVGIDGVRAASRIELRQYVQATLHQARSISLELEWAEVYGGPREKIAAREKALSAISSSKGRLAQRSFWKSLLVDGVWTAILEGRVSEESREALLSERHSAMLSVNLDNEALISDACWARISPHIKFDRESFRARAMRDLPSSHDLTDIPVAELNEGRHEFDEGQIAERVREIRAQGRQEERIALLIREFIENPILAERVLEKYSDRAQLADYGARLLRQNVEAAKYQPQEFFPWLITELYRNCISFNRGELLYSLTRHLGDQVDLAREIRAHAQVGQSADVRRLRSRILRRLQEVSPDIFLPEAGQQRSLFDDM